MKRLFITLALLPLLLSSCTGNGERDTIVFGTDIVAAGQMEESRQLASVATLTVLGTGNKGRDIHYSYFFPEAGENMPFRLCLPKDWNGKDKLPLVMFLHGGWNDENSYLDQNEGQLVKLADEHGFILVSPLGAHAAYGNNLILPAEFGRNDEAAEVLASIDPERAAAQRLSEKDVINVLEIVMANYPVDRKKMFLCGHSMGAGGTWYLGAKYPDYWKALAPMSGPFVLEEGYPWRSIKSKPIFVTEGTLAIASLKSSRELRDYLEKEGFNLTYLEVEADHPNMVPEVLPEVFDFFDQYK